MDKIYSIAGWDFKDHVILQICKDLGLPCTLKIHALTSRYYGQEVKINHSTSWSTIYQVQLPTKDWRGYALYTFNTNKYELGTESLAAINTILTSTEHPKDYVGRTYVNEDLIFCREFFRVEQVFGSYMLIKNVNSDMQRRLTLREALSYLVIDDPLVHLAI